MTSTHFVALVHGMWGNPGHVAELERAMNETHTAKDDTTLHVHVARCLKVESTYDGIDWCGERVAKEILDKVDELEKAGQHVARFSLIGYSMGGLVGRYLIAILQQRGFFERVEPVNLFTVATPHAGLVRYPSMLSALATAIGSNLLSRTGEQFYCRDKWSQHGRPLLIVMADPERLFYQTLTKFRNIKIYANAVNDLTVPYVTAAIETVDPFHDYATSGIMVVIDDKYPGVIQSFEASTAPLNSKSKARSKPKSPKIGLPPFMQFKFPLNIVFYASLPLLVPVATSALIGYFIVASRSSRSRIKKLESDASTSAEVRLVDIIESLEHKVVDLLESDHPDLARSDHPLPQGHPTISDNHRKIARWLNTLPLKKELAYFPDVWQTHTLIVSRDVAKFEYQKMGEPVIRHLADSFVV